jgi:hypothetical protein
MFIATMDETARTPLGVPCALLTDESVSLLKE